MCIFEYFIFFSYYLVYYYLSNHNPEESVLTKTKTGVTDDHIIHIISVIFIRKKTDRG